MLHRFSCLAPLLACAPVLVAQDVPTYSEHVAPILMQHCATCHRPDHVAPFPLLTYADAKRRGRMIRRVTKKRFMPPWHPVAGHGEFVGENRLTEPQIATLDAWVAGGMPQGDPGKTPPVPEFTEGWELGTPDLVVRMPRGYEVPPGGPDIYRNFVVPLQLDEDKWVTAVEVRPGTRAVLHHVIFDLDTTGRYRQMDGRDGRPGFDQMRPPSRDPVTTSGLGAWAVGTLPRHLPIGLARRLPKGADLILRTHFHPSGKKEVERTTIGLHFTDKPPERTMVAVQLPPFFGLAAGIDIPAGEARFEVRDSFVLPVDALALTVGGHAHYLGKTMQIFATPPGGERRSVFYIDNWAFNWQSVYQYREPLELPKGTKLDVRITFDNSAANPSNPFDPPRRVRWGLQSTEEMGSVTLLTVPRDERDAGALVAASRKIRSEALRRLPTANGLVLTSMYSRIKMLDKNGDGRLSAGEIPAAMRNAVLRFDKSGDGELDEAEIAAVKAALDRR